MSAYAQNASGGGGGYASLSGSLLARKGEAMPAVDANAHEGVDIEMRPMKPANSPGGPKQISEAAISKLYTHNQQGQNKQGQNQQSHNPQGGPSMRLVNGGRPNGETRRPRAARPQGAAPDAWTLGAQQKAIAHMPKDGGTATSYSTPEKAPGLRRPRAALNAASGMMARKAVVTLRMPARELVRLKLASKDLEMTCQAIILDALECYLDANDVPSACDDEAIRREAERLIGKAKTKKS